MMVLLLNGNVLDIFDDLWHFNSLNLDLRDHLSDVLPDVLNSKVIDRRYLLGHKFHLFTLHIFHNLLLLGHLLNHSVVLVLHFGPLDGVVSCLGFDFVARRVPLLAGAVLTIVLQL